VNIEKTIVSESDIHEYIQILVEQYCDFSNDDKQQLNSIANLQPGCQFNFKISFEKQDELKLYLFAASRQQSQFLIATSSYKEAIKLTNMSSVWRNIFGDHHKSILKELEEIFPNKSELLGFLIMHSLEKQ
jgi:hypothetical protein